MSANPGTVFEVVEALNGFTDAFSIKNPTKWSNYETGDMQDPYWIAKLDKSDKSNKQNDFVRMQLPTDWTDSFNKKASW